MCSATGYPVAERPAYTKSIFYDRIQSGGDRMQFDQFASWSAAQWDGRLRRTRSRGKFPRIEFLEGRSRGRRHGRSGANSLC